MPAERYVLRSVPPIAFPLNNPTGNLIQRTQVLGSGTHAIKNQETPCSHQSSSEVYLVFLNRIDVVSETGYTFRTSGAAKAPKKLAVLSERSIGGDVIGR